METPPHHPAKPIVWLCPSCSSDFLGDHKDAGKGGHVPGNGVALLLCVIQVRLEQRPQQIFPLAVVGCCSSTSSKHLKRFWLQMRAAMQKKKKLYLFLFEVCM